MSLAAERAVRSHSFTQAGMVFTTQHGGEDTVWLMTRHEPAAGIVEYARVTPGSRIATVLGALRKARRGAN